MKRNKDVCKKCWKNMKLSGWKMRDITFEGYWERINRDCFGILVCGNCDYRLEMALINDK